MRCKAIPWPVAVASAWSRVRLASASAMVRIRKASASAGFSTRGDELLLLELGVAYGQLPLGLQHGRLRFGLRQRPGLGGLGLGSVDLGLVSGFGDLGLALVLSLVADRLLVGLGGGLLGLGLGNLGVTLDGGLVGCSQCGDVARAAVVDGLDLQRVNHQPDLFHLRLGGVEDLLGQPLALPDDLLHRHRADDGSEVAGEDSPGEHRHVVLVLEEAPGRIGDALVVVTDLEGDDRAAQERDPLLGDALLGHLGLLHGQREGADPVPDGNTKAPCPVTILNGRPFSVCSLPLMSIASSGAGTCQPNMVGLLVNPIIAPRLSWRTA